MACLLQPECNFLHGYFRCKLPVEVVDMEVKITSMQGMHIFRRDRTTQLVRCMPWTPNLCLHPNMVKKMRTFLEVENKMGPIILALANQYRPLLPKTNPNVRKDNATKKRRTVTPKRKFRPVAPKATATHSPIPKTPPKPVSNAASSINTHNGKTRHSMAQCRHHVRQSVPEQELVAFDRLFGHREKGRNGKALLERRSQNGRTGSQRGKVWLGAWMLSTPGTEERGQSSPSTETNGKPTATETLTQTASDKAQHFKYDQNKEAMGARHGETE